MRTFRAFYRKVVPYRVRASCWFTRNLFSHAFSDILPEKWNFDYQTYWSQRLEQGGDPISYPELVEIGASLIPDGVRVLDIGCGSGRFLQELSELKTIEAYGIDISQKAVEMAQARGIKASVCDATKEDVSRFGSFDVVTIFEVLEHIPNSEELLLRIQHWFPQAKVIVSIPNTGYIASRLRLLFGRFPRQWHVHPCEHLRFWTLHDFQLTLNGLGYEVLKTISLRGPLLLAEWWPGLFSQALVFVLKPIHDPGHTGLLCSSGAHKAV